MIRLIVKTVCMCPEGAVTGSQWTSFDIHNDALEKTLLSGGYSHSTVVGAEVIITSEQKP